jgi:hypothetical protein
MLGSSSRRRLRTSLVLTGLLVLALLGNAPAGAHPEEEQQRRGAQGAAATQVELEDSEGVRLLGHADPGGGFHADVFAHGGHAYLGSWGAGAARCPSHGVRVFDLRDPSDPVHVSTFADGASEPELDGTWTEKVIVDRFKGQDLAAVSMQRCRAPGFRGFGI